MPLDLEQIADIYARYGYRHYGESVNQREHALQCAHLAEQSDEPAPMIVACLLHDIAHMLSLTRDDGMPVTDDGHQHLAIPFLRRLLPDAVLEPIRLHVDAKRYLCGAEPGYYALLSPGSVASLALQGGPLSVDGMATFLRQPYSRDAIRLRRYDDQAKVPGMCTPGYGHFARILKSVAAGQLTPG